MATNLQEGGSSAKICISLFHAKPYIPEESIEKKLRSSKYKLTGFCLNRAKQAAACQEISSIAANTGFLSLI